MFDRLIITLLLLLAWLSFAWLLYETDYMRIRLYMGAIPDHEIRKSWNELKSNVNLARAVR